MRSGDRIRRQVAAILILLTPLILFTTGAAGAVANHAITTEQLESSPAFRPVVKPVTTITAELSWAGADHWAGPVISGDGAWIAFYDDGPAGSAISRADVATGSRTVVSTGNAWGPDISYDGSRVVYLSYDSVAKELSVYLWDSATGRQRLSSQGAAVDSNSRRPVQISDDGQTVAWAENTVDGRRMIVWKNGSLSAHSAGRHLTDDGWSLFGRDSQFRLERYTIGTGSRSVARSSSLDYLAFSNTGGNYVGSGYSDTPTAGLTGWKTVFGESGRGDIFVVQGPTYVASSVPSRLSGDASTLVVIGPDATSSYVIDVDTRSARRIDVDGVPTLHVADLSDNGRYGLILSNGRLLVVDLWTESAPAVAVEELSASQLSDQIDRLYLAVFGRRPSDTEALHWIKLRASGVGLESIAAEFTAAAEFQNRYGSLDDGAFVDLIYQNVLGRPAEAAGRTHWLNVLEGVSRADVVVAFSESAEFIGKTGTAAPMATTANRVWRLYLAYFLRPAEQPGLDYWHQLHWQGVSINTISSQFAQSVEFQNRYGSLTDSQFVDLVYGNVLGRSPESGGRIFWLAQMEAGMSRGEVMVRFSDSAEFVRLTDTLP